MSNLNKLRWHCLRGIKELDELLCNFLETHYAQLSAAEQQQFATILEWDNSVLLQCFQAVPDELAQDYLLLKQIFCSKPQQVLAQPLLKIYDNQ